jgi:hypothetical protein
MLTLFDLMKQAQNGSAMETFAKHYGLAQEQALKAAETLMPAFSCGLKRNADNPYDIGKLMFASGHYAPYFDDIARSFTPEGLADGQAALNRIFGSKDAADAIAAQAEKLSGIGQDVLKAMMPAMADTLMGGLVKTSIEQFQAAASAGTTPNPMMGLMTQWMEATGLAEKPKASTLFDNPFSQSMGAMLGGASSPAKTMADAFADNPLAKAMTEMMAPFTASLNASQASPSEAVAQSASEAMTAMADHFRSMFDSGVEAQKTYQKSLEATMDAFWKPVSNS